ncbi:FAD linked oxidase domain protein [Thermobaculum terrenum ATCC BAA-798]|uniref:FAD linked oxidase domain protein n=1 Tax=Thermobaculum terrenum (strain ATCC BAA-798 / CCMEE 7001 / YNP1) TaxID=525904 RepID=D1CH06_THET1|nr:FAD-binding and (Fe-S)-binding domain-containing protein [Thermobaculum terrenum]ACZ43027.1 FAD linked oxidase domain protein [Thermobaculum terrenum ATCC BAA-798]
MSLSLEEMRSLSDEIASRISGEVRFDAGSRALYATDASNYRQVPIGVVLPRTAEDVVETVAACRRYGVPILSRGGGTSLAGQCCNVAVVMDMSKHYNRLLELNPDERYAVVEPGIVLDELRNAAERYHLTFGPDPATHDHCTLGGMLGNNSCGVHSVMAGKTDDNVEALEVLTYDGLRMWVGPISEAELEQIIREGGRRGEIYAGLKALRDKYAQLIREKFPDIPRRVSGYNLVHLLPQNGFNVAKALVGSESTCVTILRAKLRLVDSPPARTLVVLGFEDVFVAADHVPDVMEHGPIALEGLDEKLIDYSLMQGLHPDSIKLLPEGHGWLLVEFGGRDKREADDRAREMVSALGKLDRPPSMKLFDDPREERQMWLVREAGLGATTFIPGTTRMEWPGWEDSAVAPDRLGDYLRDFRKLLDKYGYNGSLYGHFGQGCLHTSTDFDLESADGVRKFREFIYEAADLVVGYGGSLSGEHGDGQARGELLEKMFGKELVGAFQEFKALWDPEGKMNPGKVVNPYRLDENLRLGPTYDPPPVRTHFAFISDDGDFSKAALRCVGVGKCRRHGSQDPDDDTMCPSYMVTREEMHATRGRARLLFEMLQGNPLSEGWRSEAVREALDLCLACKGCKADCPVSVDMATYKAEFLSHYYEGRLRPRAAYSMGLIYWWARLASHVPSVANLLTQTPILRSMAKLAAGIAPQRRIPAFAPQTFKDWFFSRYAESKGRKGKVILWADTFNNYFLPETARAAVRVLEAAGFEVEVPRASLCCGRPLYDWGMLDLAKRQLRQILQVLEEEIQRGTPVVVLEPSCASVFRDELVNLFPRDKDAQRLSQQTYLLSEFLQRKAPDWEMPTLERKALVHGHCHHKAIMGMGDERAVLESLGLDFEVLPSGCCGMAGAFGFEPGEHYEVSIRAGERVLLPAVRSAEPSTVVIADGFSCREQIAQMTHRRAMHLAQVIDLALRSQPTPRDSSFPERLYEEGTTSTLGGLLRVGGALAGLAAAVAASRGLCRRS